jgi:hypothetical protein
MSFDIDTYIRTQGLTGGPIITGKVDEPIPTLEPFTDEEGKVTLGGKIGYLLAYGVAAGALGYWFLM